MASGDDQMNRRAGNFVFAQPLTIMQLSSCFRPRREAAFLLTD